MAKKLFHVYTGHHFKEYKKKFGDKNLQVLAKADVDKDESLLNDKSWWIIKDKYYQVPNSKNAFIGWWKNLDFMGKAIYGIFGVGVVATAIAVPVAVTLNQRYNYDISVSDFDKVDYKNLGYDNNGDISVYIVGKGGNVIESLTLTVGNYILIEEKEYTYNQAKGSLIVYKAIATNHPGKLNIQPNFKI